MKLKGYLDLMSSHPELFHNEGYPLRIIRQEPEILDWQNHQRQKLSQEGLSLEWADIGILAQDPYVMVLRDLVEFPDGRRGGYIRSIHLSNLDNTFGVIILPILNGQVLLMNHFRHSTRQWHLEIPRGYGESGLSAEENAARELREEINADVRELIPLGILHPETGFESQRVDMFLARLASVQVPAANEGIESFVCVSVSHFEQWIVEERITDSFTIAAYARAKLKGLM